MSVMFTFSSIVQSSNNQNILPGDVISGSVVYDSAQFGSNGLYTFTGSGKIHSFNWKAFHNGLQVTTDAFAGGSAFYQIIMSYNVIYQGQVGTLMTIKGATITGYIFTLELFNLGNVGITGPILPRSMTENNFALNNGVSNVF